MKLAPGGVLAQPRGSQAEVRSKAGSLYQGGGLVFASEIGTSLEPSNIDRRSFKPPLKKVGLPDIRFHDLRHTCPAVLLSKSVNPKFVQELLGHARLRPSRPSLETRRTLTL